MVGADRVYKVVLFGVTGSGKSSIINLLSDKQVADVSTDVEPCTRRARWYPISLGGKEFRLWDTMGFNRVEGKGINPLPPYEQAHTLLRNLPDGVDLILLCSRIDRINASLRKLYWLLDGFFFRSRASIALVLTHFDTLPEQQQPGWWDRSKNSISHRCNIPVQSLLHACITAVHNGSLKSNPPYQRSKQALETLLEEVVGTAPTLFLPDISSSDTAVESLNTYCRLNIRDAAALVEKVRLPQRPLNAILFGESGAGKSSVINLLVGRSVAEVSPWIDCCTLDFCGYEINTGLHQFQVWDTVGFNGTNNGHDMCWTAIQNAARLVRDLHDQGGVDLLVFCKKEGRLQPGESNTFKLFYEFLCGRQIPVAFIITHREYEDPMEGWWERHGGSLLKTCSLKPNAIAGHACITSQQLKNPKDQVLCDQLTLSRQLVQEMLEDSISHAKTVKWVTSLLAKLAGIASPRREKVTVKNLTNQCKLSKEAAEELIKLLYT